MKNKQANKLNGLQQLRKDCVAASSRASAQFAADLAWRCGGILSSTRR